jgi:DNA-binding PadR family transcriptional regulator
VVAVDFPLERVMGMSGDSLGEFEHQVLLAALRLGRGAYSVSIVVELEERTGREVAQAAVYITLHRLEEKGYLQSELDDSAGRTRRYVAVTEAGLAALRDRRRSLVRLWDGLEPQLEEG